MGKLFKKGIISDIKEDFFNRAVVEPTLGFLNDG